MPENDWQEDPAKAKWRINDWKEDRVLAIRFGNWASETTRLYVYTRLYWRLFGAYIGLPLCRRERRVYKDGGDQDTPDFLRVSWTAIQRQPDL